MVQVARRIREYLKQANAPFLDKSTSSCTAFIDGDPIPFINGLESFYKSRNIRSITADSTESHLQVIIEAFWSESRRCLSELCLVVDPTKASGNGRFGFIDLFVAPNGSSGSAVPVIELKNLTIQSLLEAAKGTDPDDLRKTLLKESDDELLRRQFRYWDQVLQDWRTSSVKDVKDTATIQVQKYLRVAKEGSVGRNGCGILDSRIHCEDGKDRLDGYVVVCIGGTRILVWKAGMETTRSSYRIR